MSQRHQLVSQIALGLWTFAVFSSVLSAELLNWDDPLYLSQSRVVREFDWVAMFTAESVGNYHPLTMLSLAIEHRQCGPQAQVIDQVIEPVDGGAQPALLG